MVEEKKIPRGYKKTEAGVIPEEWEIKRIGDLLEVHYGKDQRSVKDENGTYPILGSGGQIGWSNEYLYDKESVLIGRKGTIDRPQHTEKPFWTIDTLFYTKIFGNINPKYIYYLFKTINWRSYNEATGVPSLNTTTVESIRVASPPFPEQLAIAEVLSDVDDLINSIESLIDKKQKIKQGAMQELLTGKKRLPGFSGAWETRRIAELGDFGSGDGFPIKYQKIKHGEYPFFKVSDMSNQNNEIYMNTASNYISEDVKNKIGSTVFPKGTIVFAKIGAAIFLERKRILVHPSCIDNNMMGFIVNEEICNINFIHMVLTNMKFGKMTRTSALPSLNSSDIGQVELLIPKTLHEQQAIAQILSDMDYEIETLEEKLKKYRALKQGMMQELLTGRIRLL